MMELTSKEAQFLTILAREQNQTGCQGPAHDLLRKHAYPDVPLAGRGSLAFSYELVPLTSLLLDKFKDLEQIDRFLRTQTPSLEPEWPWSSAEEFRGRLKEAQMEHDRRKQERKLMPAAVAPDSSETRLGMAVPHP